MSAALRAIVVDDEPLARTRVRTMLAAHPEVALIAECGDGHEALEAIARLAPDLVFLDVQMPELDGFAVLEALAPDERPAVVFVTAHDRHALRAFEVSAVDYLLKPYDRARFAQAITRASERRRGDTDGLERLLALARAAAPAPPAARFAVRDQRGFYFVAVERVAWIEAAGNYVRLHADGGEHLVRGTLQGLAARLDAGRFVRVHRSAIVNVDYVARCEPSFHGELVLILGDGTRLTSGRGYGAELRARLLG